MPQPRFLACAAAAGLVAVAAGSSGPGGDVAPGPSLTTARMAHKITTLPDGDVLVVGGRGPGFDSLTTAELWSPATNTWTQVEAAAAELDECAFVKLSDGRYLVAGGAYDYGITPGHSAASIFDPATKTFSATGSMAYQRFQCNGAQLANGNVLIVGGWYGGSGSALYGEIYEPSLSAFTSTTGPMTVQRSSAIVVPCNDGTALVFSGYPPYGGNVYERVESYDPVSNSFSVFSESLIQGEAGWIPHVSSVLPHTVDDQRLSDGRYLFFAYRNNGGDYESTLFTIDPATKAIARFQTSPELPVFGVASSPQHPTVDRAHGVAYVPVQLTGTNADFAVYAVDLATGTLEVPAGSYHVPSTYYPSYIAMAALPDGRLLLTGGYSDSTYSSAIATTFLMTPSGISPPTPPSAPTGLSVSITGPDRMRLDWTDTSANETGFEIHRSTDGGVTWPLIATVGAGRTWFEDQGVTPAQTCAYKVHAFNSAGDSAFSGESSQRSPAGTASHAGKLAFGKVKGGRERVKTLKVRNTSRTESLWIDVNAPRLDDPDQGMDEPFTIRQGGGPRVLAPRETLEVTVAFVPASNGAVTAYIDVLSSDAKHPERAVKLTARGTGVE